MKPKVPFSKISNIKQTVKEKFSKKRNNPVLTESNLKADFVKLNTNRKLYDRSKFSSTEQQGAISQTINKLSKYHSNGAIDIRQAVIYSKQSPQPRESKLSKKSHHTRAKSVSASEVNTPLAIKEFFKVASKKIHFTEAQSNRKHNDSIFYKRCSTQISEKRPLRSAINLIRVHRSERARSGYPYSTGGENQFKGSIRQLQSATSTRIIAPQSAVSESVRMDKKYSLQKKPASKTKNIAETGWATHQDSFEQVDLQYL